MLRTLVDNLPDFIYAKDCRLPLPSRQRIRRAPHGHDAGRPARQDGLRFLPARSRRERIPKTNDGVMRSGEALINREEAGLDANGNAITLLTTKVPLRDEQGRVVGILGIGRDITARVKVEAEIRAAREAAEAANRAKSDFLANMSHEIRTPMNGVLGMSELLLESRLDAEQRDCAETIRESGKALLTVINDILDFSKIEAGKLELESIDMDVRSGVEECARLLAIQAHAKGLELEVSCDPELPEACAAIRTGCDRFCSTSAATRSSSRAEGRCASQSASWRATAQRRARALRSARLRHRHSARIASSRCSSPSPRWMRRRRAASAAPGSGFRSCAGSSS